MDALLIMLKNVMIFVLLAVPGYLMVKTKILSPSESGGISKILTWVGLPFMILTSTLKVNFTKDFAASMSVIAIFSLVYIFFMFFTSVLLVKNVKDAKKKGVMRFSIAFANNGFLGIPLANAVFGNTHPEVVTFLVVSNIINNVLLFTLGVYLVSGDKKAIQPKRILFSPVLIAFVIGMIINLTGLLGKVPEVGEYSTYFSNIVTALSMTVLGIKLADIPFGKIFLNRSMYYVSLFRIVLFPILAVAILFVLRTLLPVSNDMIMGMFIAFVMPTASLASSFADTYNGDVENAVSYTLGSTLLSVGAIPLLYWLLDFILTKC